MPALSINQLNIEVTTLKQDIGFLRSLLISLIGKDQEGVYNPKFVKDLQKAVKENPNYTFQNKETFLSELKAV